MRFQHEHAVDDADDEERRDACHSAPELPAGRGFAQHGHHQRRRIEHVDHQDPRVLQQQRGQRQNRQIDHRCDRRFPQRHADHRPQIRDAQQALPVQPDVLHEAVRPSPQLLPHEREGVRLDGIAHGLRHEAHLLAGVVHRPGQVHVFRHGARLPAAVLAQHVGAIDREAARGDQRLAEVVLNRLVETECEQIFDVAAALPDAADVSRHDEAAGRRHRPSPASPRYSFSIASGATMVSASTASVCSVVTCASANVCAPALDPVFAGGRSTVTP